MFFGRVNDVYTVFSPTLSEWDFAKHRAPSRRTLSTFLAWLGLKLHEKGKN